MKSIAYHSNLSAWMRNYIIDLTKGIADELMWKRHDYINSPGWTMMHLIAEGEYALCKLSSGYQRTIMNPEDFLSGADGNARTEYTLVHMLEMFGSVYSRLDEEVQLQLEDLRDTGITDEELQYVLTTELDYFLHILTTHIAMHCDALNKWRSAMGLKSPYAN